MGSSKWGYKSPNIGYHHSYPTYNTTYTYPWTSKYECITSGPYIGKTATQERNSLAQTRISQPQGREAPGVARSPKFETNA